MFQDTATFPFRVNKDIKDRIGTDSLHRIGEHLWPVDCQSCGHPFGPEVPALVVNDLTVMAAASLHHAGCRAPSWNEGLLNVTRQDHLSYRTLAFMLPTEVDGRPDPLPTMLVNPSLEQVLLKPEASGWTVATMGHYRDYCGLTGVSVPKPVPDAYAQLHPNGLLTVTLERTVQTWEFETTPDGLRESILARRGVALGVTSAYIPGEHFVVVADFLTAMQSGQIALGWVTLRK
ncbi:hypothetical protein AB0H00_29445 [Nocardia sp. NPDC023852]|uniref:hypothetical protein n=1 Tax=Nocardia sp. NPDC023852 TaxID=3154697 RepID=UPI0033F6E573